MKRYYQKPEILVVEITQNQIICASEKLGYGQYDPSKDGGRIEGGEIVW